MTSSVYTEGGECPICVQVLCIPWSMCTQVQEDNVKSNIVLTSLLKL